MNDIDWKLTRRALLRHTAFAGLATALPWPSMVFAQPKKPPIPRIPFSKRDRGETVAGPYGQVRIAKVGEEILPVIVSAANRSALMDLTGRSALVRYGVGSNAVTLTTAGVKFGTNKMRPWSAAVIRDLIAALAKDRKKAQGVLLLRSALHTSYPVAAAASKAPKGKRMGTAMAKGAAGFGIGATKCVTRTVTETVVSTITETIEVVKTAEEQYQECYDREIKKDPCKSVGPLAGVCAAGICATKTFIDLVVGFVEVVTTVAEEVTREVVACTVPSRGEWPNPWTIPDRPISAALPQPKAAFGKKELDDAIKLVKDFAGGLSPFAKCLVEGKWSLAQLDTQLNLGGNVVIPYGVKVCISAECASTLSIENMFFNDYAAWASALAALAALSPEFAAFIAPYGIAAAPALAAAVAALPEIVVAAAAIILAFIILALIYGTAISAQLAVHKIATNNFADGEVCIEHPTFALALIKMATFGVAPAELIPPIVTG